MEVYECVSREEALRYLARTLVGARWIDATMALAPDQKHAAGCVDQNLLRCKDVTTYLFSATLAQAATRPGSAWRAAVKRRSDHRDNVMLNDVKQAFLHGNM